MSDPGLQTVHLRAVRIRVRRGQGLARGRYRARHPVGRHPRGLELPGLRCGQIGLRNGGSRPRVTPAMSVTLARVTRPRVPYPEASRALLRDSVLDAMREETAHQGLVGDHPVRRGPHRRYQQTDHLQRVRLPTGPGPGIRPAAGRPSRRRHQRGDHLNVGNVFAAFSEGFRMFFTESAADPLVISLLTGVAKPTCCR